MGRHSIPDPEGSSSGPPEGAGDATEQFDQPLVPPDDYRGYRPGPPEPDYPRYGEPDYDEPAYPRPRYTEPEYPNPNGPEYREPGYQEPEFETEYESDYSDDYESDYPESDYPASEYSDLPEYLQAGYRETETDEPEYRRPAAERPAYAARTPEPKAPPRASHSGEWEGGEWTGSHRAIQTGRRGVSWGVIGALVAVVVVVAGFILWRFFGDALSNRSSIASARCVDGQKAVAVIADPAISDEIGILAKKFNETANPVGDSCVALDVKAAESDQVVNGFVDTWPAELGERPALWIPGSSISQARLEAVAGEETVDDSRSLVSSPVVLAIRPQLKAALGQQNWRTLPGLQSNPNSLNGMNLPGWGSLRLALPLTGDSDASYLAAEAVAAASAPAGAPASAGTGAVNTLMSGQPKLADNKSATAMDALLKANDPAGAPVHAVVTTEQQLYQRGASLPDAKNVVASWIPPGPTATADYPTVLLKGTWLSQEQITAASEFSRFLRKPEQLGELAKLGFRTDGGETPKSDVTNFAPGLGSPVRRRLRDAGHAGQRAHRTRGRRRGQPGGHDHARPVDDRPGGRQDPAGQRHRRTGHGVAVDAADLGGRAVDLRRCRGSIRGPDGSAGRSCRREAPLGRPRRDTRRSNRIRRRCRLVHHIADDLRRRTREVPSGTDEFGSGDHGGPTHRPEPGRRRPAGLRAPHLRLREAGRHQRDRLRR